MSSCKNCTCLEASVQKILIVWSKQLVHKCYVYRRWWDAELKFPPQFFYFIPQYSVPESYPSLPGILFLRSVAHQLQQLFLQQGVKKTCNVVRHQKAGGTKLKRPIRVSGHPPRLRNMRGICFVPSPFADLEYFCMVLFLALVQSGSLNTHGFQCLACFNIFYRIFYSGSTLF